MSERVIEAYEKFEDFWLSSRTLAFALALFSGLVALSYPLVLLLLDRWAGFPGLAAAVASVAFFTGLARFCGWQARRVNRMLRSYREELES